MNTRRYPRTLQEAFGPYTSSRIHTDETALLPRWVNRALIALLITAFGGLLLPTGCTSEQETAAATAADVGDAMQEAATAALTHPLTMED